METKDIIHSLNILNPNMSVAKAIKFYEEIDKLDKEGVLDAIE